MSAAFVLPDLMAKVSPAPHTLDSGETIPQAAAPTPQRAPAVAPHAIRHPRAKTEATTEPLVTYAFYRKHTEKMLRRYLYASMQVGRSPNILAESIGRGWVSSRRVRTFEDALIFVLDIERCLKRISVFDRQMITRIYLQEYTQVEAADLLRVSHRTISNRLPKAMDNLTRILVEADLLIVPN